MDAPPTAEHLARHLCDQVRELIENERVRVESVRLFETPTSCAKWP